MLVLIGKFGFNPCSKKFATAKQNFKILEWGVFVKAGIFHFPKTRRIVAENSISRQQDKKGLFHS